MLVSHLQSTIISPKWLFSTKSTASELGTDPISTNTPRIGNSISFPFVFTLTPYNSFVTNSARELELEVFINSLQKRIVSQAEITLFYSGICPSAELAH